MAAGSTIAELLPRRLEIGGLKRFRSRLAVLMKRASDAMAEMPRVLFIPVESSMLNRAEAKQRVVPYDAHDRLRKSDAPGDAPVDPASPGRMWRMAACRGRITSSSRLTRCIPDVEIADWLSDRYPDEMTVVMQHWFDNLEVTDEGFSVTLNFGETPETLYIPYDAIKTFVDPSVEFGLRFETHDVDDADEEVEAGHEEVEPEPQMDAEIVSLDKFRKSGDPRAVACCRFRGRRVKVARRVPRTAIGLR